MQIREQLEAIVDEAIAAAIADGSLAMENPPAAALERPRDEANGDWASTVAMRSAKLAHAKPRDIAQAIVEHMPENDVVKSCEIAGPGFINFRLTDSVLQQVVSTVREQKAEFGKSEVEEGKRKVNLEYISANPTGPMHIGHGRWAALGDSMARVMRHAGYDVFEEFYVNDHGTQMDVFGNSISVRYMQLLGHDVEMPEQCYGGAYVADIAQGIIDREGRAYENLSDEERMQAFREIGYHEMLENQKTLLEKFGTTFDCWFSERNLYVPDENGKSAVDRALEVMNEKGYIFEAEDATWFRSSEFGDDKDRVLIKANGELTYFTSDMAYHYDKVCRGFDHLIDIWGADHHGYIKRCEAMMEAWGHAGMLEVVLGQLVNLLRDGEPVRMSKRTGKMISLSNLLDEVPVDSARYFFNSKAESPVEFDLDLAVRNDGENPVYYVKYAHARICTMLENLRRDGYEVPAFEAIQPEVLRMPEERSLIKKLAEFPDEIASAAQDLDTSRLNRYAKELAGDFHKFYTDCRVKGAEESLLLARLYLSDATRQVLASSLRMIGIKAPQKM